MLAKNFYVFYAWKYTAKLLLSILKTNLDGLIELLLDVDVADGVISLDVGVDEAIGFKKKIIIIS